MSDPTGRRSLRRLGEASAAPLVLLVAACSTLGLPLGPSEPRGATAPAPGTAANGPGAASPASGVESASRALLVQSRAAREAGRYGEATALVERALRFAPNDPSLWLELGEIQLATGNTGQASAMAQKALSLAGGDTDIAARARDLMSRAAS